MENEVNQHSSRMKRFSLNADRDLEQGVASFKGFADNSGSRLLILF